ncbi:hypothetical protein AC578_1282 [Pseudocercospora eumusae]|uniref:Uncharacterized protein n=1 Tax=Pseudocercospora eumusae TaxID=321146 RepID=A0A139HUD0_9PEZI|nr:hypothetical protein AC578_1282 [Pseudocercospora eumusae]
MPPAWSFLELWPRFRWFEFRRLKLRWLKFRWLKFGRGLPTPESSRNNLPRVALFSANLASTTSPVCLAKEVTQARKASGKRARRPNVQEELDAVGERLGSEDQSTIINSTRSTTSPTPRPKPLFTERFGPFKSPAKPRERRILAKASLPLGSSQHSPRSVSKASEQSSFDFNFDRFKNLNIGSSPRESAKASPTKRSPSKSPPGPPPGPQLPLQLPPLPSSASGALLRTTGSSAWSVDGHSGVSLRSPRSSQKVEDETFGHDKPPARADLKGLKDFKGKPGDNAQRWIQKFDRAQRLVRAMPDMWVEDFHLSMAGDSEAASWADTDPLVKPVLDEAAWPAATDAAVAMVKRELLARFRTIDIESETLHDYNERTARLLRRCAGVAVEPVVYHTLSTIAKTQMTHFINSFIEGMHDEELLQHQVPNTGAMAQEKALGAIYQRTEKEKASKERTRLLLINRCTDRAIPILQEAASAFAQNSTGNAELRGRVADIMGFNQHQGQVGIPPIVSFPQQFQPQPQRYGQRQITTGPQVAAVTYTDAQWGQQYQPQTPPSKQGSQQQQRTPYAPRRDRRRDPGDTSEDLPPFYYEATTKTRERYPDFDPSRSPIDLINGRMVHDARSRTLCAAAAPGGTRPLPRTARVSGQCRRRNSNSSITY